MKVIIAGSRSLKDKEKEGKKILNDIIQFLDKPITDVVCGEAIGPDTWGKHIALFSNLNVISMPADWNKYGKAAGPIRNREMAKVADFAIILWDGESRGAKNMIEEMVKLNKPYILQLV